MAPLIQEVEDDPSSLPSLETGTHVPTTIQLTENEARLRDLLLDTAKHIDETNESAEPLVLRFTGGWVRDKLLGVPSHDIDVGISSMTGLDFGLRIKDFLGIDGNLEKYNLTKKDMGGLHQIKANPEKSKHLETVTTRILGYDVDLVNLRKETYSEDSRNPQMEFGTPEEDALRRDATVNAMFYNINTGQIEDFTGHGRTDMAKRIIRTPLEPYQTFKDDPLRVLRLIRFASRLDYSIDDHAQAAMTNQEIKDALRKKISRERVGIELEKALRGPHPETALELVFRLDLYKTIFWDPTIPDNKHFVPEEANWQHMVDQLARITAEAGTFYNLLIKSNDDEYVAWLLTALAPYHDAPLPEPSAPGKKAPSPIAVQVAREGIKAPTKICNIVASALQNRSEILEFVDRLNQQLKNRNKKSEGEDFTARDVLGMTVRRWGSTWREQVIFALMSEIADTPEQVEGTLDKYRTFMTHLQSLGISDAYNFKPLIDGKSLAKAMSIPPGPWMKDALDVVMAYQLRNPDKANIEDAVAEVQYSQQIRGELTSALVSHVLRLIIRPLFQPAKPSTITNEGRKNTTEVLPPRITMQSQNEDQMRPWKHDPYALALLGWVLNRGLNEEILEREWPLIIPPVLTLLDDWETKYKEFGAKALRLVLLHTPSDLLKRTGLRDVFEDALVHCLSYLPTVTPEEECVPLLTEVYPALYQLYDVAFMSSSTNARKVKFLDNIIRAGILHGYEITHQYPGILALLFAQLRHVVELLQLETVRHLKFVVPMLTVTLSHPLLQIASDTRQSDKKVASLGAEGSKTFQALLNAVKALRGIISSARPRIPSWRGEILKGLTLCWLKAEESQQPDIHDTREMLGALQEELKTTAKALKSAVSDECDWDQDISVLVEADSRLKSLFQA
ncbi:poly A polymerase C-terminal region-like protein [Polychaeton citri CBS 116435]|uniref:Poly A polymerase C-terminal region-like protein n=1 Tax=Polychaeton citri CBS 116435 TaxID=1314669 RepID=A0A9P4QFT1_9PEZI|nr:poly A polymerase C-terminal region-like protein [Polychaeton citri CBS 116435]